MDTDKIIIAILILVVFGLVLYLCLRKNTCQPCLQPWTGDQLNTSFDLFRSILPTEENKMLKCLISELSRKMSFEDFKAKNNTERLESILYIKENCRPQPWTGGQLTSSLDIFRYILPTEDDNMLKCLISELSRKMSFEDFKAKNNTQRLQSILYIKENCLQPWTGEQLTSTFNMLSTSTILPPDMAKDKNLIQCFVSELSRKMSFKDFQTKNDAQIREIILGVKGNWSNCMKNSLMENLLSIKKPKALSTDCVKCIIGTLEQQYSPIDITNMKKEDLENIMKTVIMSCPPCK